MNRRHKLLMATSLIAPSCAPAAPAAHRGTTSVTSGPGSAAVPTEAATSTGPPMEPAGAGTIPPAPAGPTTTVTVTVPTVPRTTTTFVLPEKADDALTDDEWWATQPGFVPGACGGSLPPCAIMRRESGGDPTAVNATGCGGRGCYGKWQFDPRTSRGLGYPLTMDQYPESVQDDAARKLWAGGAGCSHWGAC